VNYKLVQISFRQKLKILIITQVRGQWWALLSRVTNIWVPYKEVNCLTGWKNI